ncbi:MAG: hypothetical protein AB7S65_05715 [Sulfuricurvum sp.]
MGMEIQDNKVMFTGMVYEDEVVPLRDFLQSRAPEKCLFDLRECDDIHLAVLQLMMAYAKMYDAEYNFSDEVKLFQNVCEGFEKGEHHCA